jgi:hypothetical protein
MRLFEILTASAILATASFLSAIMLHAFIPQTVETRFPMLPLPPNLSQEAKDQLVRQRSQAKLEEYDQDIRALSPAQRVVAMRGNSAYLIVWPLGMLVPLGSRVKGPDCYLLLAGPIVFGLFLLLSWKEVALYAAGLTLGLLLRHFVHRWRGIGQASKTQ